MSATQFSQLDRVNLLASQSIINEVIIYIHIEDIGDTIVTRC